MTPCDRFSRQLRERLLARIIHERFYCNRGFAAATSLLAAAAAGGRARRLVPQRTAQVRLGPSRLHAPVSRRDSAISRRTVMNNAG